MKDTPEELHKRIKGWEAERLWRKKGASDPSYCFFLRMMIASFAQGLWFIPVLLLSPNPNPNAISEHIMHDVILRLHRICTDE